MNSRSSIMRGVLIGPILSALGYLALRPSPFLQEVPWVPSFLGDWSDRHGVARNVLGFGVAGLALFALVPSGRRRLAVMVLAGFAAAVEIAQIWIPARTFDLADIGASWLGVGLAWLLWAGVERATGLIYAQRRSS